MELDLIRAVQSIHTPFLDAFFEGITIFGEELFMVPLLAIIYWTINKKFGETLAYTVFTSLLLNNTLKEMFSFERPIGEEGIRTLRPETATGKSFPSGHSQNGAATGGAFMIEFKKKWLTFLLGVLIFLIGLSRIYLGVHYPKDAVVGILLGLLTAFLCARLLKKIQPEVLYTFTFLLFIPALFFAGSEDFIKSFGSYAGFFLGILLEKNYVQFEVKGTLLKKVLRVLIGILLILLIKEGLGAVFPEEALYDLLRYFLVTFTAIFLYPLFFKKFNL
ncbi:phosphatase PAP2 family protein [Proteiniclasticum ruminis]|uniref:PAP2 superfamily protein n=1 Tax=Proteiniclasticum ruminis TaxID=398199 RepID=A0A1I4ZXB3_9CLOT|nr:phosphatase PAP2 family protein [Proteiniclasticum ruminis]SFN54874.1 PAP2 superfamily protein [Proteiniclasticum ruminis]